MSVGTPDQVSGGGGRDDVGQFELRRLFVNASGEAVTDDACLAFVNLQHRAHKRLNIGYV